MCAHTERREAQTFPTAPSRALHAQPRERRTHAASPGERQEGSAVQAEAPLYTLPPRDRRSARHTGLHLFPPHPHSGFGAVPLHRLRMLRLKLCSSWKWRGCTGERRRRAGKGFLGIFCSGIYFFFFVWQTRIPFELIHFFLPRISNDNA